MSEKIVKTICRYASDKGHSHLLLEKNGAKLLCRCSHGQESDYLRLDPETETSITETFRRLVGAADNDLFANKRFKIADTDQVISGRATLLPATKGEKLLITLSSESPKGRRLSALGLTRPQQALVRQNLRKKSGLIIIAASEENGATSSYYSLLLEAANGRSTYSLEAFPVKNLNNINTLNLRQYPSPAAALEKILRLDSEVIGVDAPLKASDLKTLWHTALTGRLVIITLAADNAAGAVKILRRAGISAENIAAQTNLIIAQKLFKRPCTHCLRIFDPGKEIKELIAKRWPLALKHWPKKIYHNHGCRYCNQARSQAQTAVFEIMRFLPDGRLQAGYEPLIQDALQKANLGLINIEDIANWAGSFKKV